MIRIETDRVVFAGGKGGISPSMVLVFPLCGSKFCFPPREEKFPVHGPKPQPGKRGREVYYYKNILFGELETLFGDLWVRFGHYRKVVSYYYKSYCLLICNCLPRNLQ